eukprot:COSAG05_NODE_2526_length_2946_cov_1.694064_2_plen_46_part_01
MVALQSGENPGAVLSVLENALEVLDSLKAAPSPSDADTRTAPPDDS